MALFGFIKNAILQSSPQLEKPHFYKAPGDSRPLLDKLLTKAKASDDPKERIRLEYEIALLRAQVRGEDHLACTLADSSLPLLVLPDLQLADPDKACLIDCLIISPKYIMLLATRELAGHIEVKNQGEFRRTLHFNGHYAVDMIPSPISRNTDCLDIISQIRSDSMGNQMIKLAFQKNFPQFYFSMVVQTDPEATLDVRKADLSVKSQIIRCGQLVDHLAFLLETLRRDNMPEKHMYDLAAWFLARHQEI